MLKRMLSAICVVSLSTVLLVGCGAKAPATPTTPSATPAATATTALSGVLTVGVDDSYPPMEFKDETGKNIVGFDIDVANELAKRLGKAEAKFESTNWDGIFAALDTNKFDCIISSVSINPERTEKFSLTKPYVANKQVIVTAPTNTDIKSLETLVGKKVSAQSGTTSDELVQGLLDKGSKINFSKYDTVTQALDEVKLNRMDAAVIDKVVAAYYVKMDPTKYKIAWESSEAEPLAICFRKADSATRDKTDAIIAEMSKDGTMKKISEKWFGEDITAGLR